MYKHMRGIEIGKIDDDHYYAWNEQNAKNSPDKAGVYGLFESEPEVGLIYIGSTSNIRERFTGYWNTNFSDDPCKRATKFYKREVTDDYKNRETELLEQYKREHNGKLPRCNQVVP
jgi:excinuclease UvrABC nuclease subunit